MSALDGRSATGTSFEGVPVAIVLEEGACLPSYESSGAAGADVRAHLEKPLCIAPGKTALVPTGLRLAIPEGYEVQVRPRSGLALKKSVSVLNSPGTIDSDYRGQLGVILINHGQEDFVVNDGDRIAQLVLAPVCQAVFKQVGSLDQTERGGGGFGSTGV